MTAILRDANTVTCVVSDAEADSTSIDFRDFSSGIIVFVAVPEGPVRVYVSTDNISFFALADSAGTDVALVDVEANEAIAFPDEVFAAHYVKFVDAVADPIKADQTCTVLLKG